MSISAQIEGLATARNTIRTKMISAGQATESDSLSDLASNLKFYTAGDGINIDDNEISTERMTAAEISDLNLENPGQPSGLVYDFRGTELVVGKVIEADGTEKKLYQKAIDFGALPNATTKEVAHGINGLDNIIKISSTWINKNTKTQGPIPKADATQIAGNVDIRITQTNIIIQTGSDRSAWNCYVTLLYTKTTD